jgi:hypothetical protein
MRGFPFYLFSKAKALVGSLLVHDYVHRATVHDALQSRWIDCERNDLNITYQNQVLTARYH